MTERRVLVISYYFPPAGGPGVQRVLKTVKYLPEFGWKPTVLTVDRGAFPSTDASMLADVPPDIEVVRTASLDPLGLYQRLKGGSSDAPVGSVVATDTASRVAAWIRANVFIPDARVGWLPFAVARGLRLMRSTKFDAILTSGPPHSVQLTGLVLNRLTGIPWMADFRDPWTDINYYHELPHTALAAAIDQALERMVLRTASAITTVSDSWAELLAEKANRQVHVVQNGFDEEDFPHQAPPESPSDAFVLTYAGSLYASRNMRVIWDALASLIDDSPLPLRIEIVGTVDPVVRESIEKKGLDNVVRVRPYLPHADAIDAMRSADALLLVIEDFPLARGMLTGKIYEYLASGRPVIGVGPADGDASRLLEQTGGGRMIDRLDEVGLRKELLRLIREKHRSGRTMGALRDDVKRYSRREQTRGLAALADEVVTSG